jgi:hypothetical protein
VKSTAKNLSNQSTGLGPERTTYCSLWTETIPTDTEKSKVSRPTSKEEVDSRWRQAIRKTLRFAQSAARKTISLFAEVAHNETVNLTNFSDERVRRDSERQQSVRNESAQKVTSWHAKISRQWGCRIQQPNKERKPLLRPGGSSRREPGIKLTRCAPQMAIRFPLAYLQPTKQDRSGKRQDTTQRRLERDDQL